METIQDIDKVLNTIELEFNKAKSHVNQQIRRLQYDLQTMENSMYKDKCQLLEKKCVIYSDRLTNRETMSVKEEGIDIEIKQRPVNQTFNPMPKKERFQMPNLDDEDEA